MCVWRWYLVFHTHTCVCVYVRPFLFPWCVDSCFPSAKSRHLFPGLAPSGACSSSKVWKPKSHQLRRNSSRFHATTCAVRFNRLSIAGWRHFRNQNSRDVGMLGIPSGDFNIATMVRFWMIYPLQMTFHSYVSYVTLLKDTEGYLTYGPYGPYGFSFLQISPQNMASLARHGTIPLWYLNGSLHAVIDWTSGHCSSKYLNWTSYLRHISAGESDRHHLVKFFLLPHDFSFLFHPIPQNEISTCGLVLGLFTLDSGTGGDWIIRGMAFYNTCLILFPPSCCWCCHLLIFIVELPPMMGPPFPATTRLPNHNHGLPNPQASLARHRGVANENPQQLAPDPWNPSARPTVSEWKPPVLWGPPSFVCWFKNPWIPKEKSYPL